MMGKLLAEGVQVTALHNHLLRANPPPFYMHIAATGRSSAAYPAEFVLRSKRAGRTVRYKGSGRNSRDPQRCDGHQHGGG